MNEEEKQALNSFLNGFKLTDCEMKTLVNLINKKQAKIEDEFYSIYIDGFYDGERKWKDKIEDKIRYNKAFNDDVHIYTKLTLEELLDEEIEEE